MDTLTVFEYIERFLAEPTVALGALGRLARAIEEGYLTGLPDSFHRAVCKGAVAPSPFVPPVVVKGATGEDALSLASSLRSVCQSSAEAGPFTYSWKEADSFFTCPYRHDPLLLIPPKSREELLARVLRCGEVNYPIGQESRQHCPWCAERYERALLRTRGVWEELVGSVRVHLVPDQVPGRQCPGARVMAANRNAVVLEVDSPGELGCLRAAMGGNGTYPPVVGLLLVPVDQSSYAAWKAEPETEKILGACWILEPAGFQEDRTEPHDTRERQC